MIKVRRYRWSFVLALLLHITVFSLLLMKFAHHQHYVVNSSAKVQVIQAVAVDQQQVARQLAAIKAEQERRRRAKLAHIRHLRALALAAVKRHRMEKLRLARARRLRAQAVVAKKQRRLAQLRSARLAREKKLQAKQQRKAAIQQAIRRQIAQEAKQMAAQQTRAEQSVINRYKALIVQDISQRWIVPANLAQGVSCQLIIHLAPGGTVLNVAVTKTSGDPVLDRSAKTAVLQASPLPVPGNDQLFNNFRELKLTVRPDFS